MIIPNQVKDIGAETFYNCKSLINVVFGQNVMSIGQNAFANTAITSIDLSGQISEIMNGAFDGCKNLEEIIIGKNVISIGSNAFRSCSISTIYSESEIPVIIDNSVFSGIENLHDITLYVNRSAIDQYSKTNVWKEMNIQAIEGEQQTYTVTAVSSDESKGTTLGSGTYESGTTATIVAVAKEGYAFSEWSDGNKDNPRRVQVTTSTTYTAQFVPVGAVNTKYTLTVLSTNEAQGSAFGTGTYEEGMELLIAAFANEGYHFTQWHDGNTDNPRIISITSNTYYLASFAQDEGIPEPAQVYMVSINGENCSLNINNQYPEGTVITIEAIADECFEFQQWSDGNKDNPRTVTVTKDMNLTAEFNKLRYTITGEEDSSKGGKVQIIKK